MTPNRELNITIGLSQNKETPKKETWVWVGTHLFKYTELTKEAQAAISTLVLLAHKLGD